MLSWLLCVGRRARCVMRGGVRCAACVESDVWGVVRGGVCGA